MDRAGILNTYLFEIFRNHKLTKIFQKEHYEKKRANFFINELKEKSKKIAEVFVRASPVMEFLTGIMVAFLIFYASKLVSQDELDVNSFFSFLAAMMLAYQPVRSLATINISIQQGLAGAKRVLPIIDERPEINDLNSKGELNLENGDIIFKNVSFSYEKDKQILNNINLKFSGKKMTALVGHSGAGKSTILNLIPRFYNVEGGDIIIDNKSIYQSSIHSLRKN